MLCFQLISCPIERGSWVVTESQILSCPHGPKTVRHTWYFPSAGKVCTGLRSLLVEPSPKSQMTESCPTERLVKLWVRKEEVLEKLASMCQNVVYYQSRASIWALNLVAVAVLLPIVGAYSDNASP